jgi:alpha-L-arabinofuranosidase
MPHSAAQSVRAIFSSPQVGYDRNGKPADFWSLNGSASVSGKHLTLTVTNPHLSETRETEIAIRGARIASAKARVLSEKDASAHNTFENPKAVEPRNETATVKGETLTFRFAPASVTQLQFVLQ